MYWLWIALSVAKKANQVGVWIDDEVREKLDRITQHFANLTYDKDYSRGEALRVAIMMTDQMLDILKEHDVNTLEELRGLLKKK